MKVLFVPDSRYWITATIAERIVQYNSHISGLCCSVFLLDSLLERAPNLINEIDLIHFLVPVAGRRYLPGFLGKIPCVSTIHHIEPGYASDAVSVNATADAVMVVSGMWRDELVARGVNPERIVMVPNGVDSSVFRPPSAAERQCLRRRYGFGENEYIIGFCGKPGRDGGHRKGIDIWVKGLKKLAEKTNQVAAAIGGPGWEDISRDLRRSGIKVYWRRFEPEIEDGAPFYRALDFYWVTSRIEGAPVPLLEAMSSGLCCLSTRVGIAPEIITTGENGYLVEMEDADQFAELTYLLLSNHSLHMDMGGNARKCIVERYNWSQTTVQVDGLYQRAFANFEKKYKIERPVTRAVNLSSNGNDQLLPLHGRDFLDAKNLKWLKTQEKLGWLAELGRMGERRVALRMGWRTCFANIHQLVTWRLLGKLFVPLWLQKVLKHQKK